MNATLWRIDEGKLRLAFHEGQARAWKSDRRFVAMIAGSQSGKTSFGPFWLHREIERGGPGDYLAVTSSFDLFKLKALPAIREVFEHLLRRGRYWPSDRVMELADPDGKFWANRASDGMWGRLILRSASAGGGLEAATAKAAWLDEAGQDEFTVEAWEAVLRRLALAQGRILVTTTPYSLGWLKTELYDRWIDGDPTIEIVQFASTLNPSFPHAEFERARATLPSWKFQMFYEGLWARPAGLIYGDFDPAVHVCAPFEIPASYPRYLGCDFGGVNTAHLVIAHDTAADRYFVISEGLEGGKATNEHVAALLAKLAGVNFVGAWGGAPSEDQARWDWAAAGLAVTRPPVADLEAGIDRVVQLLRERRIQVFRTCTGLLDEFSKYRRKLDGGGQPLEEIEAKRTFHRLDALRYVASALVNAPSLTPVSLVGAERESGAFSWDRTPSEVAQRNAYGWDPTNTWGFGHGGRRRR